MGAGFNTPTSRLARSGDIPVWDAKLGQWIPQGADKAPLKSYPTVYNSGGKITSPKIDTGFATFTGTGAALTFNTSFNQTFTTVNGVVLSIVNASNVMWVEVTAVSTTTFTHEALQSPANTTMGAGMTWGLYWIATGT